MKKQESLPASVYRCKTLAGTALLLALTITGSASAASITYSFTTATANSTVNSPSAAATALSGLGVSGSFTLDTSGMPIASGTGGALYLGFNSLEGMVGDYSFTDSSGLVAAQNDSYMPPAPINGAPFDLLQLSAEPGSGLSGNYNLQGFTIPGYTLANVRLFWIESLISNAPDFLNNNDLPSSLPTFSGRLALDFVPAPYNPVNGQPSPATSELSIVFFDDLKASPVTPVPIPASLPLFVSGLLGSFIFRLRKSA